MKAYLAGPMSGIASFNLPAFDAAAKQLRMIGHQVVSPAEMDAKLGLRDRLLAADGNENLPELTGETWSDFLARDLKVIVDGGIDAIVCLPGWERSRGARLETFAAHLCGLPIYRLDTSGIPIIVGPAGLVQAWAGTLWKPVVQRIAALWA